MGNKHYSEQLKRDAVKLVTEPDYSLRRAAEAPGVSQTTLSNWKKAVVPREPSDLEAENRRLREANRELRQEREILKKAATWFASQQR
jgi:transposase